MGCECCYAMFAVLLFIVLYHGPKWFGMDGFENYTKIYKSEDGWFVSIRQGGSDGKGDTNLLMLMHNDWTKFKQINEIFDSGDKYFMKVDGATWDSIQLPDWDTFFLTRNSMPPSTVETRVYNNKTYPGYEEIGWQPIAAGKLFGQRFLQTRFTNDGAAIEMRFDSNGEIVMVKKFSLYTAPVETKPVIPATPKCPACPAQKACPPRPACPLVKCPSQKPCPKHICPPQKACPICPQCKQRTCSRCAKCPVCFEKKIVAQKPRFSWWW